MKEQGEKEPNDGQSDGEQIRQAMVGFDGEEEESETGRRGAAGMDGPAMRQEGM